MMAEQKSMLEYRMDVAEVVNGWQQWEIDWCGRGGKWIGDKS